VFNRKPVKASQDQSNQQKMLYHKNKNNEIISIPRTYLSEALQRRLRVMGSIVSNLQ